MYYIQLVHWLMVKKRSIHILVHTFLRSALRESARAITDLTPEIIIKAKEVLKLNTQEVEPLHQSCEQWAGLMTYLQNLIDGIIEKWKTISDKVMASSKLKNVQLMVAQVS